MQPDDDAAIRAKYVAFLAMVLREKAKAIEDFLSCSGRRQLAATTRIVSPVMQQRPSARGGDGPHRAAGNHLDE